MIVDGLARRSRSVTQTPPPAATRNPSTPELNGAVRRRAAPLRRDVTLLPFCRGSEELNVLKSHLRVTIRTLLQRGASQREIERSTGDRKTIRRYERQANSPGVTTGFEPGKSGDEPRSWDTSSARKRASVGPVDFVLGTQFWPCHRCICMS